MARRRRIERVFFLFCLGLSSQPASQTGYENWGMRCRKFDETHRRRHLYHISYFKEEKLQSETYFFIGISSVLSIRHAWQSFTIQWLERRGKEEWKCCIKEGGGKWKGREGRRGEISKGNMKTRGLAGRQQPTAMGWRKSLKIAAGNWSDSAETRGGREYKKRRGKVC